MSIPSGRRLNRRRRDERVYDKDWIRERYEHCSIRDIRDETGYRLKTIQRLLLSAGVLVRLEDYMSLSDDERSQLVHPYIHNKQWMEQAYKLYTYNEVANNLECHKSTVYRWMKHHGIEDQAVLDQKQKQRHELERYRREKQKQEQEATKQRKQQTSHEDQYFLRPPIRWGVPKELAKTLGLETTSGVSR